jgi:16S rRNA (adenine1518-N6/adenine1519-N6)-dimethyltransferase
VVYGLKGKIITEEKSIFHRTSQQGIITLHARKGMYTLKKSLGQHFLHDEGISRKIVQALPATPGMQVLEVGPGGGALTRFLMQLPDIRFKAVEIDAEKINYLIRQYPGLENTLVQGDILKVRPPFQGEFSIIGNFPYNISSQILFRILEWKKQVPVVVGMFQKEVAGRIVSGPGSKAYGILSVLMQAFYRVEYLFEVHESCFTPPPKVRSAVVRFTYLGNPYDISNEKKFFTLVKTSFNQRRKMLRNPLKQLFTAEVMQAPVFSKRAEELGVSEFVDLSKQML